MPCPVLPTAAAVAMIWTSSVTFADIPSTTGAAMATFGNFFSETLRTAVRQAFSKRCGVNSAGLPMPTSSIRLAGRGSASRMARSSACLPVRSPASLSRVSRPPLALSKSANGPKKSAPSGTKTISQSASADCQGVVTARTFIGGSLVASRAAFGCRRHSWNFAENGLMISRDTPFDKFCTLHQSVSGQKIESGFQPPCRA